MHEIRHSDIFEKQIRKHGDKGTIIRLLKAIKELELDPLKGEILGSTPELLGLRSLRCGDWRIAYEVRENDNTVLIIAFGHGHEVYDELPRYFRATKKRLKP